jgi:hypothetical protein
MIFSEKVRGTHLLRKNHPLNQQYLFFDEDPVLGVVILGLQPTDYVRSQFL